MEEYTGDQIAVLKGLEAVRMRPGMYIGNTSERGLHQLVYEAVDNSVDEAMAGKATTIVVVLGRDNSCSVEDDGRGIPVDFNTEENMSSVEVVMTILHAGGKFGSGGYKVSGGLHGVGISVVNALSENMTTRVKRDGMLHEIKFERGITTEPLHVIAEGVEGTGTYQWFVPDHTMFDTMDFHWDILQKRLRELAFLNRGISITLRDERPDEPKEKTFLYEGGIISFVEHLNEKKIRSIRSFRPTANATTSSSNARCSGPIRTAKTFSPTRITSTPPKAACISSVSVTPLATRSTPTRANARCSKSPMRIFRSTT